MRRWILLLSLASAMTRLPAQRYHLRDGTVLEADEVTMRGGALVQTLDAVGASAAERSYPLGQVVRLEWPEPAEIGEARQRLASADPAGAVEVVEPVRRQFVPFAKVPGSWWTEAALLRLRGLLAAGTTEATAAAARELIATTADAEAAGLARLALVELEARAGRIDLAQAMLEASLRGEVPAGVQARAWLLRASLALAQGAHEEALEAFLRIPVFFGTRGDLQPEALLGSARAYLGLGDRPRAERAARDLMEQHPDTAQAAAVRELGFDPSPP